MGESGSGEGGPRREYSDGRPFRHAGQNVLSVADNGKNGEGEEQLYSTRTVLDIEGNQRAVIDALGRTVMRYEYDMPGADSSAEHGGWCKQWMLNDVAGRPLRIWNNRDYALRLEYDALHRPMKTFVRDGRPAAPQEQISRRRSCSRELSMAIARKRV